MRETPIAYYASLVIPASVATGSLLYGAWSYLAVAIAFVAIPLLDLLNWEETGRYSREDIRQSNRLLLFRIVPLVYATAQLLLIVWVCSRVASGECTILEFIGLTLSMGIATGGVGIAVAHELIHKTTNFERIMGKAMLMLACYMHYFIEHNAGHHTHVATPADPSSARFGESFYRFLPRTLIGSYTSAWKIEKRRLQKKFGKGAWNYRNKMLQFGVLPIIFFGTLAVIFGWLVIPFALGQAFLACTILEVINYVEHYGLQRKKLENGRYEPVGARHSWEANSRLSNIVFFRFQRHADHHLHPSRNYHVLQPMDESPKLPAGYPAMAVLAFAPPLWMKVMNPIVKQMAYPND